MSSCGEKVRIKPHAKKLNKADFKLSFVFITFLLFLFTPVFSERYQIKDVTYTLDKTREKDLRRTVSVNTERIFESKEEFDSYLSDLHQRLMNTRAFDSVEILENPEFTAENIQNEEHDSVTENDSDFQKAPESSESLESLDSYDSYDSSEIIPISLQIKAHDTKSLLILPYPKYDSNSGFIFKVKVKDVNFLGTMNTMNIGAFVGLKEDVTTEDQNFTFGAEFDYRYPFYAGPFICSWNNKFDLEYTRGVNELEFHTGTGLSFELPFKRLSFILDVSEQANRDLEYEEYNDTTHFTSNINLSMPVKIFDIENWGFVFWTPFTDAKVSYDKDGINIKNDDLASPVILAGESISTKRINWYGNFRSGISAKIGHTIGYDFQQEEIEPRLFGELQAFKSFTYFGINSRFSAFLTKSNRGEIGKLIRGVRDKQKYANYGGMELRTKKALKTSSALVLNLDFPVHIITTHWLDWSDAIFGEDSWFSRTFAWTDKFNFELQISPFVDIALTKNEVTGRLFSLEDGWYTGGVELLVFPERWKGIVMRGSIGIDLGRAIISKKYPEKIDMSWRENVKKYEIYAGIGLLY